jgi:hypothetical protein
LFGQQKTPCLLQVLPETEELWSLLFKLEISMSIKSRIKKLEEIDIQKPQKVWLEYANESVNGLRILHIYRGSDEDYAESLKQENTKRA